MATYGMGQGQTYFHIHKLGLTWLYHHGFLKNPEPFFIKKQHLKLYCIEQQLGHVSPVTFTGQPDDRGWFMKVQSGCLYILPHQYSENQFASSMRTSSHWLPLPTESGRVYLSNLWHLLLWQCKHGWNSCKYWGKVGANCNTTVGCVEGKRNLEATSNDESLLEEVILLMTLWFLTSFTPGFIALLKRQLLNYFKA